MKLIAPYIQQTFKDYNVVVWDGKSIPPKGSVGLQFYYGGQARLDHIHFPQTIAASSKLFEDNYVFVPLYPDNYPPEKIASTRHDLINEMKLSSGIGSNRFVLDEGQYIFRPSSHGTQPIEEIPEKTKQYLQKQIPRLFELAKNKK